METKVNKKQQKKITSTGWGPVIDAVRSLIESTGVEGTMPTDVGRAKFWLRFTASSTIVEAKKKKRRKKKQRN